MRWSDGQQVVDFLLERGRLERIVPEEIESACEALLERATKRLATTRAAAGGEDWEGAFANAYDVYRMAADCLLLRQGFRATGGDGSHVAVEDAVSAQFGGQVPGFAKMIFERFRQGRHASQYFDPGGPDKTNDDARWALATASRVLEGARELVARGSGLEIYE